MYKSQDKLIPETAGSFHVSADKVHSYPTRSVVSGNVFFPRFIWVLHGSQSITFSGAEL